MEKFTPEIKADLISYIDNVKKMLDGLTEEIKEIPENSSDIGFSPAILKINKIVAEMGALKTVLKAWQEENFVEINVLGE